LDKAGAFGRKHDVAGQGDFKSAANSNSVGCADYRLFQVPELGDAGESARAFERVGQGFLVGAHVRKLLEIPTCTEYFFARACNDAALQGVVILQGFQCLVYGKGNIPGDSIGRRPVQGDFNNLSVDTDNDFF